MSEFNPNSGAKIQIRGKEYSIVANSMKENNFIKDALKDDKSTIYADCTILDGIRTSMSYSDAVKLRDWLGNLINIVDTYKKDEDKTVNIIAAKAEILKAQNALKAAQDKLKSLQ